MLDAAGNEARELNAFEKQYREQINSGELKRRYDALIDRRSMPLSQKIELSLERIEEWIEAWGREHVAVSYSGGNDSRVLLWLVRKVYPECPAIFANTGLEYPEIVSLVKSTPNVLTVRPKMPFHKVISTYGYPMVSKKVARGIKILKYPTGQNQNIVRLYDEGINRFGEKVNGFKVAQCWRFLVHAPFDISDHCCEIMKKEPMRRISKELGGIFQFVGMMASDSKAREKAYLQHGCNAFDAKHPSSMPMSFWTKQDVLECIHTYRIPYAPVYGRIVRDSEGIWGTTGVTGTGCVYCGFGLHMEKGLNRFQLMYETHPKLWKFSMERLGLGAVLDYMREHCPKKSFAKRFVAVPAKQPAKQTRMW